MTAAFIKRQGILIYTYLKYIFDFVYVYAWVYMHHMLQVPAKVRSGLLVLWKSYR